MSRDTWFRLDVGFLNDPGIVVLGDEFGCVGPLTIVGLFAATKAQEWSGDVPGEVEHGWIALGRAVYCRRRPGELVRRIIERAADLRLIELLHTDDIGFRARVLGWTDYQRPASEAERARAYRERKRHGPSRKRHGGVTKRDGA